MKHQLDDGAFQTNLLQAFQKNKIIQGKLSERQRLYYVKLIKDMQDYSLKEKLNRELLYTWKKETYVRQLRKNLQDYEKKRFGVRDAYYDYQARNLDSIITGQQGLVIPPSEEERRINVNAKFKQFLQENPLDKSPSMRIVQSANVAVDQAKQLEEENARAIEKTWQQIHAQSAVGIRKQDQQSKILPSIQRSLTMDEIRRNENVINSQTKFPHVRSTLPEIVEPISIQSETLQKQTGADLIAMRSVRRPQRNPIDLNIAFESRKRIYQINKRVYNYRLCPRKCGLQYNSQFDREQTIDPSDDEDNLLIDIPDNARRRYEERHQLDKNFL